MSPATPAAAHLPVAAVTATRRVLRERLAGVHDAGYRAVLRAALTRPGRLLAGGSPFWVSLPLACAVAAGGDWRPAAPVAQAFELTAAALELLDDLEDEDLPDDDPLLAYGRPRLLNLSTGLLTLALSTLDGAAGAALAEAVLTAAGGQEADLAAAGTRASERLTIRIAQAKSAGLIGCAARLGALAGGATDELAAGYRRFGEQFGLASQFANDLRLVRPGGPTGDLTRRAPTVLLAAAGLTDRTTQASASTEELVAHVRDSGASSYVWVLAESAAFQAEAELDALAAQGQAVTLLRALMRSKPGG